MDDLGSRFGNRYICEDVPDHQLPESGMPAVDAMRLIAQELVLDGDPQRNLATFATLADDIAEACDTLDQKGGLHPAERRLVKVGTGY